MNRLEQKCLMASAGMHGLLILLLVVGSAFFVETEKPKPPPLPNLRVVPDFLVEGALAGGGGNPNVKPSEEKQKGETLIKPPEPTPAPPQPKPPQPKPVEVKPERTTPPKETKPDKLVLKEVVRPNPNKISPNALPDWLKPVSKADREKAAAEETARQWAANAASARQAIGKTRQGLQEVRRGFADGTVVTPFGPGGLAYAPYAAFVKEVYDDAWRVDDLTDETSTCVARVTIARDGEVLSARILTPSGNSVLDRSVQRALNSVRSIGHAFPAGATEQERTFTINFNLKSKRGLG
jgi:TonB family protein